METHNGTLRERVGAEDLWNLASDGKESLASAANCVLEPPARLCIVPSAMLEVAVAHSGDHKRPN
jgi:hypothetical protein